MIVGKFKTGYLQREVYVDAVVTEDLKVWQAVVVSESNGTTQISAASNADEATHIIAQSDTTANPYGHVPVELGRHDTWNYLFVEASDEAKHVALFKIFDKDDVVFEEVE